MEEKRKNEMKRTSELEGLKCSVKFDEDMSNNLKKELKDTENGRLLNEIYKGVKALLKKHVKEVRDISEGDSVTIKVNNKDLYFMPNKSVDFNLDEYKSGELTVSDIVIEILKNKNYNTTIILEGTPFLRVTENNKEIVSIRFTDTNIEDKHYLGESKWVLYTYICDLENYLNEDEELYLVCGKFAYSKLRNMNGFEKSKEEKDEFIQGKDGNKLFGTIFHIIDKEDAKLDLNGEIVNVYLDTKIENKIINIYKRRMYFKLDEEERPKELLKTLTFA